MCFASPVSRDMSLLEASSVAIERLEVEEELAVAERSMSVCTSGECNGVEETYGSSPV